MSLFYAEIDIPRGITRVDFDRKKVNKVILKEAREVRNISRGMIARKAISNPGEFPGRQTGALWRSIRVRVNKEYSFAIIRPEKTAEMGSFHPYMLLRGTKKHIGELGKGEGRGRSNRRRRGDRGKAMQERAASGAYIIKPRDNYMIKALDQRRYAAREAIATAVKDSLVPRKYGN